MPRLIVSGVDTDGKTVEGDPRGAGPWSSRQLAGAGELVGVACPSVLECVAVDAAGGAFVGSSGPLPPIPARISPPTIAGTPRQGQHLTDSHGKWSNGPTSYTYRWTRCNGAGRSCSPIAGALGQSYVLTAQDVGPRIRVQESASNIRGTSTLTVSGPTAPVRSSVPITASRPSLSGVSRRRPKLSFVLTVGYGERRLKAISVVLPHPLGISNGNGQLNRGVLVEARGKRLKFAARLKDRVLQITLRRTAAGARVTIGAGLITASAPVSRRVRSHRLVRLALVVVATDRGGAKAGCASACR